MKCMDVLVVGIEWKWPLGEHGGSGNIQGFDKEGKEVEWEENGGREKWEISLELGRRATSVSWRSAIV